MEVKKNPHVEELRESLLSALTKLAARGPSTKQETEIDPAEVERRVEAARIAINAACDTLNIYNVGANYGEDAEVPVIRSCLLTLANSTGFVLGKMVQCFVSEGHRHSQLIKLLQLHGQTGMDMCKERDNQRCGDPECPNCKPTPEEEMAKPRTPAERVH